jgi:glycosyltransferase involved in cell wall biosynthesis
MSKHLQKAIIVSNYYYPEMGAASNRIHNLALSLQQAGIETDVICPLPNYPTGRILKGYRWHLFKHENIEKIKVFRYWIYPTVTSNPFLRLLGMLSFSVSLWLYIFRLRRIVKTDVVIIQNSPLLVSYSAILLFKCLFRKKVVLNVSDIWPLSGLQLGAIKQGRVYDVMNKIANFNYKRSDLIVGQSNEILNYIGDIVSKPFFLYRNLPNNRFQEVEKPEKHKEFSVFYAGLLGVAQGILKLIQNTDFKRLGIDFDIYGKGNEEQEIIAYLKNNPDCRVHYKGQLSNEALIKKIPCYHASIVPLQNRILGAVPSKIFELMQSGVPIIFCGGGEGAAIVNEFGVGLTSAPGDYQQLYVNLQVLKNMSGEDYQTIVNNCVFASEKAFSFATQFKSFLAKLSE